MTDVALSAALVAYVWGDRGLAWPGERPEALSAEQQRYLGQIRSVLSTAFAVDPNEGTLSEAADRAALAVRARHPELSGEAVSAVRNLYCFQWK